MQAGQDEVDIVLLVQMQILNIYKKMRELQNIDIVF